MKHLKTFGQINEEFAFPYSDYRVREIADLLEIVHTMTQACPSLINIQFEVLQVLCDIISSREPRDLEEVLEKLKKLKPKIEDWDPKDELFLREYKWEYHARIAPACQKIAKLGPVNLINRIIPLLEDYLQKESPTYTPTGATRDKSSPSRRPQDDYIDYEEIP